MGVCLVPVSRPGNATQPPRDKGRSWRGNQRVQRKQSFDVGSEGRRHPTLLDHPKGTRVSFTIPAISPIAQQIADPRTARKCFPNGILIPYLHDVVAVSVSPG